MISILIPTYNYNVNLLFQALKLELTSISTDFEIICYEDGSTKHIEDNSRIISTISEAKHVISKVNRGRITTRQSLAEMAKYDWLLFLDADVIPESSTFISDYIKFINSDYDAIYGGCSYAIKQPDKQYILRWKYGKNYENVDAKLRNKSPYKVAISGNFLIKKTTFIDINSKVENEGYGYDNYVAAFMKANHIKIIHINNNATHIGLDDNITFLNKTEKAVKTLYEFNLKHKTIVTDNSLLEFYRKLASFRLTKIIGSLFKLSNTSIKKQLLSGNPNLTLLQFYKLGYLCTLTISK